MLNKKFETNNGFARNMSIPAIAAMSAMPTNSPVIPIMPTDAEDLEINLGIAADADNPECDAAWFAAARPARDVLPPKFFAALKQGNPQAT